MQTTKQISDTFVNSRQQNKEYSKEFFKDSTIQLISFLEKVSRQINEHDARILQQNLTQNENQNTKFILQIKEQNNKHNSQYIKQNKTLVKKILEKC